MRDSGRNARARIVPKWVIINNNSWPGSPGEQARGESNVGEGERGARRGRGERNEWRKSAEDEEALG